MKIKRVSGDKVFLFIGLIIVVTFYLAFYRKAKTINITVKVTDQDVLYASTNPKVWYSKEFEVGDYEIDSLGRKITEVTGVSKYYLDPGTQAVYLDIKINAIYDSRTKQYYYKGKPIVFGTSFRFSLSKVTFDALVVNPDTNNKPQYTTVSVKTLSKNIPDFVANKIHKGEQLLDTKQQVLVKITDAVVKPAEEVTTDHWGNLHIKENPVYKDLLLKLEVRCRPTDSSCLSYVDRPVIVGEELPITLEGVSLNTIITDLIP